ncbi:DUF2894 domain-containing protein [Variovorax ginsengisoli]|uniref:DUF2894 domain-containing protein n=1 Tax=Variovorax ginsengisoli TaxID=363844 RepID=A0ABT9S0R9_9BURK|nr:DUF2894 domain-containing protein [Variovorax ginsengisoli]MDP9897957.1 hypothetical protein [Variovorax ginsengisoli]
MDVVARTDEDKAEATLDAWRARGGERLDPVRFRLIEAMARRAAGHRGAARRVLDARLATLMAAYAQALEKMPAATAAPAPARHKAAAAPPPSRGPLAELVDHIARQSSGLPNDVGDGLRTAGTVPELKTLSYFRSTWSRLSADRRWVQSLAAVPENAGPLNSHHLLHRSLTLMRELSPAYFNQFMSYADALLSIEQMHGSGGVSAGTETPRAEGAKVAKSSKGDKSDKADKGPTGARKTVRPKSA